MSAHLLGDTVTVSTNLKDENGNPVDPSSITYVLTPPVGSGGTPQTYYWHVAGHSPDSPQLVHVGTGVFSVDNEPDQPGTYWRWEFFTGSPAQRALAGIFTVIDPTVSGWSQPFGYCAVPDVMARINAGSWDPSQTGELPSEGQVNQFILDGAVQIDSALATVGYFIPLIPQTGQTINQRVWLLLQGMNAAYATGMTERTRHGAVDQSEDPNATTWLHIFDDLLTRLEQGDDNLYIFGVDGPFPLVADKSLGITFGGLTDACGNSTRPFFDRHMYQVNGQPLGNLAKEQGF